MEEILHIINEMSPYLLLGFFLAGMMHSFIPGKYYSRYLSRPSFRSVINAAIFGIPLPLCSCGVIPTAMSLRKEGASKGAVASFLIATPQTGVDSIIATFSLMGWPFAIIRPIAALVTAIFGGVVVNAADDSAPVRGNSHGHEPGHNHSHNHGKHSHKSFGAKMKEALEYAFIEMMEDIGKWLVIGLIVAGLITVFVPDSVFEVFQGNTWASMLLVLCIAIPMYLCATGSIPIAVALMLKGLTPGAGLVLLMAGPACNMASILVIRKVMGTRTLIAYLASIIIGAIGFGCLIDYMQFNALINFTGNLVAEDACCVEETSWFSWLCTIVLGLLLINALILPKLGLRKEHACHCHDHGNDGCGCGCHDDDCDDDDCHCGCDGDEHCHCNDDDEHDGECHCHCGHDHHAEKADTVRIYHIQGMNCNHCRQSAEGALQQVPGVTSASVSLQTKEARITGTASEDELRDAVESLGFTFTK